MSSKEPVPKQEVSLTRQDEVADDSTPKPRSSIWRLTYIVLSLAVLFINYFLSQYDKFILSYFQNPLIETLNLSAASYGVLSGYSTGIVYALAAIPIAYLADRFPGARVWVLTACSLWWSLCVIFQSLAQNFWQILLARIGMGLGQSAVEPLSISLISDLTGGWRNVFIGESVLYMGVYIGEVISGQISLAFTNNQEGWRIGLRAIGITGLVVAVFLRLIVRDQGRIAGVLVGDGIYNQGRPTWKKAKDELSLTVKYLVRLRSGWLLLLAASTRQLAGNVFGYYMPGYLASTYPSHTDVLSRYGIIAGVVGSVAVLSGGFLTSLLWNRTVTTPLWLTGVGGMISSVFVMLMLFSKPIGGIDVLYGSMSAAYITAELWLGAVNGLIASILPPRYKTFGLAIWASIQALVYSSGPEIIGLALQSQDPGTEAYRLETRTILACFIVICYWLAGFEFLGAITLLKQDMKLGVDLASPISKQRKTWMWGSLVLLAGLVVALFVASIVYATL